MESWAELVRQKFTPHHTETPFSLSVIIPVFNCSEKLTMTLESIKRQKRAPLEIIIVDAMSTDHTVEIIRSYAGFVTRVYSVGEYNLFDMVNRGVSLASGQYITVLTPGSVYLSDFVYDKAAEMCSHPFDMIYFGSIQRERGRIPRMVNFPFSLRVMEQGIQPATLSACFFKTELFETLGKFQTFYKKRALLDLFFRIKEWDPHQNKVKRSDYVYVDFDNGQFGFTKFIVFVRESWKILHTHLGLWKALIWFLGVSHMHLIRWGVYTLKRRLFHS